MKWLRELLIPVLVFANTGILFSQSEWNREYYGTFHMLNHNFYPSGIELTKTSIPNRDYPLVNICDSSGDLLFYSSRGGYYGRPFAPFNYPYLWNKGHNLLRGSEGRLGFLTQLESKLGVQTYEQGFSWQAYHTIVPVSKRSSLYYQIGVAGLSNSRIYKLPFKNIFPIPENEGVLWAGKIEQNKQIGDHEFKVEKEHILGHGFGGYSIISSPVINNSWLIAANWRNDSIYSYAIDSNGLHLAHVIAIPGPYKLGLGNAAYGSDFAKVSPDGSWIFIRMVNTNGENPNNSVQLLLHYNVQVGQFEKSLLIGTSQSHGWSSAVEFTPDSKELIVGLNKSKGLEFRRLELSCFPDNGRLIRVDSIACSKLLSTSFMSPHQFIHLGVDGCFYLHDVWNSAVKTPLIRVDNPCDPDVEWQLDTIFPPMPFDHEDTMPESALLYSNRGMWPIRVATGNIRRLVWSKPLKTPCLGEPLTFGFQNGYRADSVRWNFGDGTSVTALGNDVVHRFTDTGLLEVSAIFFGKRVSSDTLRRSIRVNYIHRPQLGADTLLCAGSSMVLNAADASVQQYRWSHGPVTASTRIDTAGTYVLEVENEHCIARDTVVVGLLSCDIRQSGFCAGDSSRVSISGLQPDSFKLWANGNPVPLRNKEAAILLDTGLHQLLLEQHVSGMSRRLILQHRIHPLPAIHLGPDTLLCTGQGFVLQAPTNLQDYRWSNGSTANAIEITNSGSYHLQASDGRCVGSDTLTVVAIDCRLSLQGYCLDDTTVLSVGNTADSALVRFGDGNASLSALPAVFAHRYPQEGNYELQVHWFNNGLQTSSRRNITITAVWEPFLSDSLAVCKHATLEPEQLTTGARYQWSNGSRSRNIRITEAGSYPLGVQKGQCRVSDTVKVSLLDCQCRLFMPNTFTPNMNGTNDALEPVFDCVPEAYQLLVYNRWGQLVFDNQRSAQGWNGRYRGEPVPDGVFVWQLNFKDPLSGQFRSEKGTVLVLR